METSTEAERLTPEDVREFQDIVARATGVHMSTQEAWDRAIELIALFRMLIKPYPEDESDNQFKGRPA